MLLLTKIGKDVKREARIEEQWHRNREESDKKISSFREKMAYHLQKRKKEKKETKGKKMALKEEMVALSPEPRKALLRNYVMVKR